MTERRWRGWRRWILLVLGLAPLPAVLFACGQDPIIVPIRNLERPTDMAFSCLEVSMAGTTVRLSGRPMKRCHPPGPDMAVNCETTRTKGTFGLVTNSSRGEVGVVDLQCNRLVDLDTAQPGYNMLPVGTLPEAVVSTQDGCQAVTANRGSCDLTMIDPSKLVTRLFGPAAPATGDGPAIRQVRPTTPSGRALTASPQEVVFLPQTPELLDAQTGAERLCQSAGAVIDAAMNTAPWRALVSFPGCDLVALIELPSGTIVSSVRVGPDGAVDAGVEPVCPVECGMGVTPAPAPPAPGGGPDGGAGSAPLLARTTALALLPDGRRVYVGGAESPFVQALDVGPGGLTIPPDGGRIPLNEGAGGVTRLRLSIDPHLDGPNGVLGRFVGRRGEFLYAFARDGSVRVIDIGRRISADQKERECDVNVDPLLIPPGLRGIPCFAIGDPDPARSPPARRPLALGPGLRAQMVVNPDLSPPVPRDVAFAQIGLGDGRGVERPDLVMDGAFGFLLLSSGSIHVVNLDPSIKPGDPVPLTHSFRDLNRTGSAFEGLPRVSGLPFRTIIPNANDIPFPTRVQLGAQRGPRLEGPLTDRVEVNANAAKDRPANTWAFFPDALSSVPQTWTVIWEDILPGTDRTTGEVAGPLAPGGGGGGGPAGLLADPGADFCRSGVIPRDEVLFAGCLQDNDCTPRGLSVCRQTVPGAPGLCVPRDRARDETLLAPCVRHLASRRRYEVVRSTRTQLDLGLKIDELPTTTLNRCTPPLPMQEDPCNQPPAFAGFSCVQVRDGEPFRCVKKCGGDDKQCRAGTVCEDISGARPGVGSLCVEGPPIVPGCWPQLSAYRVQAGNSFVVGGSGTQRMPTVREQGGVCVLDPARHPALVNRIPLDAPACAKVPDGTDSLTALTQPEYPSADGAWGNPCLFRGANSDETPPQPPMMAPLKVKALFQNTQLRLLLTNLDEYSGDAAAMRLDVIGGFFPTTVLVPGLAGNEDIVITLPAKILTGPTESRDSPGMNAASPNDPYNSFPYLYVIDQGRSVSSPNGRGQILRFTPRGSAGLPRFDSNYTVSAFHIQ